jgi:hypothetical protein
MLFVTWVTDPFRPTRDLDLLGHGDNDEGGIADTCRSICAEPVAEDGVVFDIAGYRAAPIREEIEIWRCAGEHDGDDCRSVRADPG